ncbi:hypothetical protein [Pseudomonas graminis]
MTTLATPRPTPDSLITQLCLGPSFREVAGVQLRQALRKLYPTLEIEPDITLVCTPGWALEVDQVQALKPNYQALTDILVRLTIHGMAVVYIEGEQFLTLEPLSEPPRHVPVPIGEIAQLLNTLAPVMISAFQEQQLDYWNRTTLGAPQWRALSQSLQAVWNVDSVDGWDSDDCAMARQLFTTPDRSSPHTADPYASKAYLVDICQVDGQAVTSVNLMPMSVLIGTHQARTLILCHSLLYGYQKFATLEQLGLSLSQLLGRTQLQWRLYRPDGNYFDQQAFALIGIQIEAIGAIDLLALRQTDAPFEPLSAPPAAQTLITRQGPDLEWYQARLPDWLSTALNSDLNLYARHLKDLAALHSEAEGKSYQDEIPSLRAYALTQLKARMTAEHADAAHLNLEDIEVRVTSQVVWGIFTAPGQTQTLSLKLADLALQNLIALPLGNKTLYLHNAAQIPDWLTVRYIENLITQVDIGRHYPALVKAKLLDDARESTRRQRLYRQHLQVQLPLLALQCKIRQEAGIDELGYRYVAAVMQTEAANRQVQGQRILMRPLAFAPQRRTGNSVDVVANMFVIGPQDPNRGPCLLYRPLFDQPLSQYPSPANLIYALTQDRNLQDSVLAWLPESVRSDYANYVFPGTLPSPWAVMRFLVEPGKLWAMSGPMALGTQALPGEMFDSLYKANANALVAQADRHSVSNTEARWATFKQAGWLLLNAALPFLGRTAGVAAWVWQLMDQLQALADANARGTDEDRWQVLSQLLLNLGMAITLHAARRGQPASRRLPGEPAQKPPLAPPVTKPTIIQQVPDITSAELTSGSSQPIHATGAVSRTASGLATLLDGFKLSKPSGVTQPDSQPGRHQHLYALGTKWYAPVANRWFEVQLDDNDNVMIVDPVQPARSGPLLVHNAKGEWFIDTRLRLRGGGPKKVGKKAQDQASAKAAEMRAKLALFESAKHSAQRELEMARQHMSNAPSTSAEALRQQYLTKLESQRDAYATAMQDLQTLSVLTLMPDYQSRALGYLKAQLDLNQAGIHEVQNRFSPKLKTVLDQVERQIEAPSERHFDDARQLSDMLPDMIRRLDYTTSRFEQLRTLAKEGLHLIQQAKRLLPSYTSDHLKILQVTLARNLCVSENTTGTRPQAWTAIDQIVDKATIAVKTLRDTLDERSESRLDERIETLSSLIDQFKTVDERLEDFPDEFPDAAQVSEIQRLRQQLGGFSQRALSNLTLLHAERDMLRNRPTAPPTLPRPKRKIIKTRFDGVVVGEPRLTAAGLETDLVDIKSPLTDTVIATFHEKQPGLWVRHVDAPSLPAPVPDLDTSLLDGQALITAMPDFNRRIALQLGKPDRTIDGIEQLFHQHAMRLEQADQAIESALTRINATESETTSAAVLGKQLAGAAQALYQKATQYRLLMTKERPPTIEGVEWLKNRNEITIKKTVSRRRLKSARPDYLDEYTITEHATRKVLWYAHLHYSAAWTPAKAFIAARLKTPEEVRRGSAADSTEGLSEQQLAAFYRSEFSMEQAARVFFGLG